MRVMRGRPSNRKSEPGRSKERARHRTWGFALALFVLAWGIRVLFIHATTDVNWAYSFGFKGDALEYLDHARALHAGEPYQLGFPMRAPGTPYLVAWLWDGTDQQVLYLRHIWIAMGALMAPLLFLTTRNTLGDRVAGIAGGYTAVATGPLLLNSSLCNETPYLLLAILSLGTLHAARETEKPLGLALFGALSALACLFRAEHIVFVLIAFVWMSLDHGRFFLRLTVAVATFLAVLLPWHLTAWAAIDNLNNHVVRDGDVQLRQPWTPEAKQRLAQLPAFARLSSARLIEETVRVRGRREVRAEDLGILEEAYEYIPEPLASYPFIASSGPFAFYLGNHEAAAGGFSRQPLFELPPLHGGNDRYPAGLMSSISAMKVLALSYPPHIRMINRGYEMGWQKITEDPGRWFRMVLAKLDQTWAGAAHGLGGSALPLGMSGVRRKVDIVTPENDFVWIWRGIILALCLLGLVHATGRSDGWPFVFWILTRLAVVVAFYGYARHGALLTPAIGVLIGLALDRYWNTICTRIGCALLLGLLAFEGYRYLNPPEIVVGGVPVMEHDPMARDFDDQKVEVR